MSYASRQDLVLHKPYKLPRTGHELPAGSYVVNSEPRFVLSMGQTSSHSINYLEIPYGVLGPDHVGGTVLMSDDELDAARSETA